MYLCGAAVCGPSLQCIVELGRRWQPDQLPASVATMSLGGGNTAATQQSLAICHNIANLATGRFYKAAD